MSSCRFHLKYALSVLKKKKIKIIVYNIYHLVWSVKCRKVLLSDLGCFLKFLTVLPGKIHLFFLPNATLYDGNGESLD